jgi:hypothetical protein
LARQEEYANIIVAWAEIYIRERELENNIFLVDVWRTQLEVAGKESNTTKVENRINKL